MSEISGQRSLKKFQTSLGGGTCDQFFFFVDGETNVQELFAYVDIRQDVVRYHVGLYGATGQYRRQRTGLYADCHGCGRASGQ